MNVIKVRVMDEGQFRKLVDVSQGRYWTCQVRDSVYAIFAPGEDRRHFSLVFEC